MTPISMTPISGWNEANEGSGEGNVQHELFMEVENEANDGTGYGNVQHDPFMEVGNKANEGNGEGNVQRAPFIEVWNEGNEDNGKKNVHQGTQLKILQAAGIFETCFTGCSTRKSGNLASFPLYPEQAYANPKRDQVIVQALLGATV
ncbi:hypothetical protein L1987_05508 [Smallanthus sonchifolius]|uniref:Uncharacterized protein n=1 Tax=Smallanthus sonchifolius TaxID=185202 RepID=A0ACB9JVJ9_9ASTR|nr:hypothetical protein L1987_05508 [Smallanthus sonchifolius]